MEYRTIKAPSKGMYKEKGSKFLSFAFPVEDETAVMKQIKLIRKLHPKARHLCFAYRIGTGGNHFRANDAGEPSGTAGKPILGQIDSFGLTNVLLIVVRYFGGILLGTSGLIRAYRTASKDALQNANIIRKKEQITLLLNFDYGHLNPLMDFLKKQKAKILEKNFDVDCRLKISIDMDKENYFLAEFRKFEDLHFERIENNGKR